MRDDVLMSFSVRVSKYQEDVMLNMCDDELLGSELVDGEHVMRISGEYYGGDVVSREEAAQLLQKSKIINIVGSESVALAIELGLGSKDGTRMINDVPFMLVFKM